jgi:NADH-quinone oxidoreductase subunit G
MVIVGAGAIARPDGLAVLSTAARLSMAVGEGKEADWNGFNVLHAAAARVAGLDLGFVPGEGARDLAQMLSGDMEVVYLLGADELDMSKLGSAFVVYQGSHGDAGAHRADVILPGAAYTEKHGTYVNTEGRAQQAPRAVFPPGEAKEDWTILRALSPLVGHTLPYDSLKALRAAMYREAPALARIGSTASASRDGLEALSRIGGALGSAPFESVVRDYYLTNPIARASAVMAELSRFKALAAERETKPVIEKKHG